MMRACHVCGSTTFDIHSGLFYCRECNSYEEEFREEAKENEIPEVFNVTSLIKSAKKPKKSKDSATTDNTESQWLTCEGFNVVLVNQVCALIKLGASPSLKEVVLKLWAKYLEKTKVCFPENPDENYIPSLGLFPHERDIKILYRKEKEVDIDGTKETLSKTRKRKLEDPVSMERNVVASDSMLKIFDISSNESYEQQRVRPHSTKRTSNTNSDIKQMSISKTLYFCYLGLLLNRDAILLSDFWRFVKEGHVPYMDVTSCFPTHMKLTWKDKSIMSSRFFPNRELCMSMTCKLAQYLGIPKIPQVPSVPILTRFICDLMLPKDLLSLVQRWLPKMTGYWYLDADKRDNNLPMYDVKAMALILVALKFLFVLDEEIEHKLSKMMRKLNKSLTKPLFVWDDWYSTVKHRWEYQKACNISSSVNDVIDIDALIKYYHTHLKKNHNRKVVAKVTRKDHLPEFRHSMKSVLARHVQRKTGNTQSAPSSFPFLFKTRNQMLNNDEAMSDFTDPLLICSERDLKELMSGRAKLFKEIKRVKDTDPECDGQSPKKIYWFAKCTSKSAQKVLKSLPFPSFKWLLNFTSELVECDPCVLYTEVVKWEVEIFEFKKE